MFVVTVRFGIKPGFEDAFLAAVTENARTSLADEPECHRFDVAVSEDAAGDVFLYELYSDRAAFDAHLASAHFKAFDTKVADWMATKDVTCFQLREGG